MVTLSLKVTEVRLLQPSKALPPMEVTPGMVSFLMPLPLKAFAISVMEAGRLSLLISSLLSLISLTVVNFVLFCTYGMF